MYTRKYNGYITTVKNTSKNLTETLTRVKT